MGAKRKFVVFSVEGILSAMVPGRDYQANNIALAYGVPAPEVRKLLHEAIDAGLVNRVKIPNRTEYVYRLAWTETEPEKVGLPYRNLRLNEDLKDYGSSLFSFANLCMMINR